MHFLGPHLEVCQRNGRSRTLLIRIRAHCNSFRSYRFPGPLHRSQARCGSWQISFSRYRLTKESLTRMHRRHTFSRRDGKAPFEGYRRSRQSRVHGEPFGGLFLSVAAHTLCRNTTFETPRLSRKAFDIRMSFTISLDGITLQSMACSNG